MGLEGAVGGRAAFQWWRRTRRRAVAAEDVDDGGCGGLEGRGGSRTDVNLAVPAPARCSTRGGGGGDAARFLGNDDGSDGRWRPQAIRGSGGVGKSGAQPRERSGAGGRAGGERRAAPRRRI
uniref:DUF834 domain-containing protein n=1 Tax=Oryza rufipogon TaxID=4529 RepID=A0A0E0RHB7_ORYRU